MKITAIVYDYNTATPISTTEINSGHLGLLNYFIKSLYPEEQALCVRLGNTQVNIELEYAGYFTEYAVTIEDEDISTPCEQLLFDTANEVSDFLTEYLGNLIEIDNIRRAWA